MIVLHGLWHSDHALCVWGESSAPARRARAGRRGRAPRHPFAVDDAALAEALGGLGLARPGTGKVLLTLSLPTRSDRPEASPFVLRGDGSSAEQPPDLLASWSVPALRLESPAALEALAGVWDAEVDRALVVADDLRFLGELAKLALAQVAHGAVVPVLEGANGAVAARWYRVSAGPAAEQLGHLHAAMPGSLRAAEPALPPGELLNGAYDALIDGFVRRALAESNGTGDPVRGGRTTPRRRARAASRGPDPAGALRDLFLSETGEAVAHDLVLERARVAFDVWTEPLRDSGARSLRLCLRLVAPAEGTTSSDPDGWRLEFLLQATDDPTLLVEARDVWRTRGRVLSAAGRRFEEPQERLLEDLGRALRLFPPLAAALRDRAPAALELDTAAAHAFLTGASGELEQAGFGVLVPSWWGAREARLGIQLRARPAGGQDAGAGLLGLDAVCAYDWRIALGDEVLTRAEFLRLARLKQPLVRVRGQWVELRTADIEAALEVLGTEPDRPITVRDVLRASAGEAAPDGEVPIVSVAAEGWLGELLANAGGERVRPAVAPRSFAGELRPYQERGLGWLAFLDRLGLGACLADDMGLGKTIQLLALLLAEREDGSGSAAGPTLLVCPMSVVGNWQREAARFAPGLRVHVHHGGGRLGGDDFARAAHDSDLVLTTYGLAARDRDVLAGVEWHRIVLDEAQNIKNSATRQARALRSLPAARRVALTGTPVENRLAELWSILDFLNPGLLGSQRAFRDRFATPIERYGDDERAAALRRMTAPFILRRLKTDRTIIADLPERIDIRDFCNLTREQASLYQAVVDEMLEKIRTTDGMERRGLVLATMVRLKQVCNHPAHLMADGSALAGRSGKLERLEEVLEEAVGSGERALVFTQFAEWGLRLRGYLQERLGREIAYLHGGTPRKERDRIVERFQSGSGAPVLLLSLRAGGTGLNLTAANHVVHFDRWWNPAVEAQASDRAFRIGQTRNVQVRKFICAGTLEERIDEMIERKKALADRIVGSGEAWLTELSTEELIHVVALSADAVSEQE